MGRISCPRASTWRSAEMPSSGSVKRAVWLVAMAMFVPGGGLLALALLIGNWARRAWPTAFAHEG